MYSIIRDSPESGKYINQLGQENRETLTTAPLSLADLIARLVLCNDTTTQEVHNYYTRHNVPAPTFLVVGSCLPKKQQ